MGVGPRLCRTGPAARVRRRRSDPAILADADRAARRGHLPAAGKKPDRAGVARVFIGRYRDGTHLSVNRQRGDRAMKRSWVAFAGMLLGTLLVLAPVAVSAQSDCEASLRTASDLFAKGRF